MANLRGHGIGSAIVDQLVSTSRAQGRRPDRDQRRRGRRRRSSASTSATGSPRPNRAPRNARCTTPAEPRRRSDASRRRSAPSGRGSPPATRQPVTMRGLGMTGWRLWSVRVLLVTGAILAGLGVVAGHVNRKRHRRPDLRRARGRASTRRGRGDAGRPGDLEPDRVGQPGPHRAAAVGRGGLGPSRGQRRAVGTGAPGRRGSPRRTDRAGRRLGGPADRRPRCRRRRGARRRRTGAGAVGVGCLGHARLDRRPVVRRDHDRPRPHRRTCWPGSFRWLLLPRWPAPCSCSRDRWRTAMHAGWALVGAAARRRDRAGRSAGSSSRRLDVDTLGGAVGRAAWRVFVRPLWWGSRRAGRGRDRRGR